MARLLPYDEGRIWLFDYPIRYAGVTFNARTTLLRLADGRVMIHSPGPMDEGLRREVEALGEVSFIVAPGNYHHLYVKACQQAFPKAETHICPGIEQKQPSLSFDAFLADRPPASWADEVEHVLVRGSRFMWEVAMFHRPSRTLLLVDLIENFNDHTPGTNATLRFWFKHVFCMWNRARPAPEYQMGWRDKAAARASLERILAWDFDRIVVSHGELIDTDAKRIARLAWDSILR